MAPEANILVTNELEVWSSAHRRISGAGLFHDPRWAGLWSRVFGEEMTCLIAQPGGPDSAMLPLVRRRAGLIGHYWISTPYFDAAGVAGNGDLAQPLLGAARELVAKRGDRYVEVRSHHAIDTQWQSNSHKVRVVMELPGTEGELFAGFKAKLRSQVRRGEREGPTSELGGDALVEAFHAVYSHRMWELGSPCQPRRLFRELVRTFPNESTILIIRLEGEPVAGALLLQDGDRVLIPWASTLSRVNRLSINMVLYARAMVWAINRGATQFDFGRSDAGSGQVKFKSQWGGEVQPLHWYRDPARAPADSGSPKRELAQNLWRRLPLQLTRVLGPRVIPYFS